MNLVETNIVCLTAITNRPLAVAVDAKSCFLHTATPCITNMDLPSQHLLRGESISLTWGMSGQNNKDIGQTSRVKVAKIRLLTVTTIMIVHLTKIND